MTRLEVLLQHNICLYKTPGHWERIVTIEPEGGSL
jgi:hypothetical protein